MRTYVEIYGLRGDSKITLYQHDVPLWEKKLKGNYFVFQRQFCVREASGMPSESMVTFPIFTHEDGWE